MLLTDFLAVDKDGLPGGEADEGQRAREEQAAGERGHRGRFSRILDRQGKRGTCRRRRTNQTRERRVMLTKDGAWRGKMKPREGGNPPIYIRPCPGTPHKGPGRDPYAMWEPRGSGTCVGRRANRETCRRSGERRAILPRTQEVGYQLNWEPVANRSVICGDIEHSAPRGRSVWEGGRTRPVRRLARPRRGEPSVGRKEIRCGPPCCQVLHFGLKIRSVGTRTGAEKRILDSVK